MPPDSTSMRRRESTGSDAIRRFTDRFRGIVLRSGSTSSISYLDEWIESSHNDFDHTYDFAGLLSRLTSPSSSSVSSRSIIGGASFPNLPSGALDWTGVIFPDDDRYIGGGSFGDVFKGKWKAGQKIVVPEVVVKVIRAAPVDEKQAKTRFKQLSREITVWHKLSHPNIVPFVGIVTSRGDYPALISLWMPNKTIRQYMTANQSVSRMSLARGVSRGLHYLHKFQPPIIHGDLKGDNILINKEGVPCLVDFGLSRMMEDQTLWNTSATTAPGTIRWKSPELLNGEQPSVTEESDIYAFGMTCVEIITNRVPYWKYHHDGAVLTAVLIRNERPPRPSDEEVDDSVWELWTTCWDNKPENRPSMSSVIEVMDSGQSDEDHLSDLSHKADPSDDDIDGSSVVFHRPLSTSSTAHAHATTVFAIDFGSSMSGVAFWHSRTMGPDVVPRIIEWRDGDSSSPKIPTRMFYDKTPLPPEARWGFDGTPRGELRYDWFKLHLDDAFVKAHLSDEDGSNWSTLLQPLPKAPEEVAADFLAYLWAYVKSVTSKMPGIIIDWDSVEICVTMPATWDMIAKAKMRKALIFAGIIPESANLSGQTVHFITEAQAALLHCITTIPRLMQPNKKQNVIICDAGGATVDLASLEVSGHLDNIGMVQLAQSTSGPCGSVFLDLGFIELVKVLLADHPIHLDAASLSEFRRAFEGRKLTYAGESQDDIMFAFDCFHSKDRHDPSVGLRQGRLNIPARLLKTKVFGPVVHEVMKLIESQIEATSRANNVTIDALLLVGGFSTNEYLFRSVEKAFQNKVRLIARPPDANTATLRGAVRYCRAMSQ